jgi:hypothetical protein
MQSLEGQRPDLDALLTTVLKDGAHPAGYKVRDILALYQLRQQGTSIDSTLNGLNLTPDAFDYLARLCAIYLPSSTDPNAALLDSEWEDICSILVQAQKVGQYAVWHTEENSFRQSQITLNPTWFTLTNDLVPLPAWRATYTARRRWQRTLEQRTADMQALAPALAQAVEAAEIAALPALRDALARSIPHDVDWLRRRLLIDVDADAGVKITRIGQAIESMQNLFFGLRNESFQDLDDVSNWQLRTAATLTESGFGDMALSLAGQIDESESVIVAAVLSLEILTPPTSSTGDPNPSIPFDREWTSIGTYAGWQGAMSAFLYPQNALLPILWRGSPSYSRTTAFETFITQSFDQAPLTPTTARIIAANYLADLRSGETGSGYPDLPSELTDQNAVIEERLSDSQLRTLADKEKALYTKYVDPTSALAQDLPKALYIWEVFFFVPLQLALQLEQAGQFSAALGWYRTLYNYPAPAPQRPIWYSLVVEESNPNATYNQPSDWLYDGLNPHDLASVRELTYTRYILASIIRCTLAFADAAYGTGTFESLAQARTLYLLAVDLCGFPELKPIDPLESLIPAYPWLSALLSRAQLGVDKLSMGLDFAGQRQAVPWGPNSQGSLLPTDYSYQTLIDRAKQLVTLAQQAEGSYLAALEKADNEQYNDLRAKQDLRVANANVTLQGLMVTEANDGVALAQDQMDRAGIQIAHYNDLMTSDISSLEQQSIGFFQIQSMLEAAAGVASFFDAGSLLEFGQSLGEFASAAGAQGQALSAQANLEEKQKDWQFQLDLSNEDSRIAVDQKQAASDHVNVVTQQQNIAITQAANAANMVNFLVAQKFTNAALYQWMSGVLAQVYSHFLLMATSVARMAQFQLAFERQEPPLTIIGSDYWQPPQNTNPSAASANAAGSGQITDTRGLTGSSRLLADIYQLDEYAFETNRRKLQVTKTISLAQLDPFAFQQFRTTGVLTFATPEAIFDADRPGDYLRLIQQVRTTVVALIPPTSGIRATLSNTGVSRTVVMTRGDFASTVVRREPQQVALNSPSSSTGLSPLDAQASLLPPFQGLGVDTSWRFVLPRASNPFDFNSIADVQIAIDYTAMDSPLYRRKMIQTLGTDFSADRGYSFAQQFPDQWYALNNPDSLANSVSVSFQTVGADFPPNLANLTITQLLMFFVPGRGGPTTVGQL